MSVQRERRERCVARHVRRYGGARRPKLGTQQTPKNTALRPPNGELPIPMQPGRRTGDGCALTGRQNALGTGAITIAIRHTPGGALLRGPLRIQGTQRADIRRILMSIRKNTEGRFGDIWRAVEKAADEARSYPDWKRGHSVDPNAERERCSDEAKKAREFRRKAAGPVDADTLKRALAMCDNTCSYCLQPCVLTVDHVVPIARGGTNDESNLLGACLRCNLAKHSKTPLEFVFNIPRLGAF